jgi:hypothetical protein
VSVVAISSSGMAQPIVRDAAMMMVSKAFMVLPH